MIKLPSPHILEQFDIEGLHDNTVVLRKGHIHDTFVSTWHMPLGAPTPIRYLHQRVNDSVFCDVEGLMSNIRQVTEHLGEKSKAGEYELETLTLVRTRTGQPYLKHDGAIWRTFHFIEGSHTLDRAECPRQAYVAAKAFGEFQYQLRDLDPSFLIETIPRFFSSPYRLEQLRHACQEDRLGRKREVSSELEFVDRRLDVIGSMANALEDKLIPVRVIHGDTKLNNVLFDETESKPLGIVDLDTCMPGYSLYDFGDLVRFTASTSAEDERDLSQVGMDIDTYRALADGFIEGTRDMLGPKERQWMPLSARLVTLTIGLRFLADYISGDVYFQVEYAAHNLDRARVQFELVRSMESQESAMNSR